ncbi:tripartite motif-containing protein 16-like [Labrus bergylta]|uniref:tripartite motif-containing protein 16-like n=1 Tax=Labrus bergylta TaxID=56723 RepID=UPI003313D341
MAQQVNQTDEVKMCCSICLDLLKDPVTIPCGHSYCMSCVKRFWDQEDKKKIPSCPQCRQTFKPRPVLVKNTLLAELVDDLKKSGPRAAPAGERFAGQGDVACDSCAGRKLKASKSCLVCVASYCEQHLQPHYESPTFKKHKLVEAAVKLQENVCSRHDEVMKMFCRTDRQTICYLCSVDQHKGHDAVSAAAERTEKKKALCESRRIIHQRIKDREEDMKTLLQEIRTINQTADEAEEEREKIFSEMISFIKKKKSDVKKEIRSRQKTEVNQVKHLQEKLEQEVADLRRKLAELEKLSNTEDPIQFLQGYSSISQLPESTDPPRPKTNRRKHVEDIIAAVKEARDKFQAILSRESPSAEPATRGEFLQYSCEIALDPNTANKFLVLSEGNRKITFDGKNTAYIQHPNRFIHSPQVLSKEGFSGRCYWEVEMSRDASVAVAYKSIGRSGDLNERVFGCNDKSWVLQCGGSGYNFRHHNRSTSVSGPKSSRVGVYLDHSAGVLSFYSISETMTLLHRVQTRFTQPLYAGLFLFGSNGDTAKFCALK